MKNFIFSILCVSVFFIGVGTLVEKTGAKFKSDEKALALIAKSRVAIGGDAAINNIQSLIITGKTTRNMKFNGVEHAEEGETEIALQLPDKMSKSITMGHGDMKGEAISSSSKQFDVVVTGEPKEAMTVTVNGEGNGTSVKRIVIKKDDGTVQELTGADADAWIAAHPDVPGEKHVIVRKVDGSGNEVGGDAGKVIVQKGDGPTTFKTEDGKTVILRQGDGNATFKTEDGNTVLLRKHDGGDMEWKTDGDHQIMMNRVGGEGHHDGMRSNDLLRTTLGLLLTAPKGMDISYTSTGDGDVDGTSCDIVVAEFGGTAYKLFLSKTSSLPVMMTYTGMRMPQVFTFHTKAPDAGAGEAPKDNMIFTRSFKGGPVGESAEYSVKFSDYRSVNGVQLPYKWTQTVGGNADETFEVTSYDINPANIAEKFQNQKVMIRTTKPEGQK